MDKPLLTFSILSYNNYKYIKEALDSVFMQDYPNIQLIISNDGSTDFDEEDIVRYIGEKRKENITQIIINNNERKFGLIRNLDYCRKYARGEFIMFMAADDALLDKSVLSRYIEEFEKLGENAVIVSSKIAMCSHCLSEIMRYEPDVKGINAIKTFNSSQMFSRLSHTYTFSKPPAIGRIVLKWTKNVVVKTINNKSIRNKLCAMTLMLSIFYVFYVLFF